MLEKLIMFQHYDCSMAFLLDKDVDKELLDKIIKTRTSYPVLEEYKVLDIDINLLNDIEDNLTENIKELYLQLKERCNKITEE